MNARQVESLRAQIESAVESTGEGVTMIFHDKLIEAACEAEEQFPLDELEAADYCPKAPDHVHVIALSSVYIEYDADAAYVDVSCAFCGRSGCLAKVDVDAHVDW